MKAGSKSRNAKSYFSSHTVNIVTRLLRVVIKTSGSHMALSRLPLVQKNWVKCYYRTKVPIL